jgi:hypothetical protein
MYILQMVFTWHYLKEKINDMFFNSTLCQTTICDLKFKTSECIVKSICLTDCIFEYDNKDLSNFFKVVAYQHYEQNRVEKINA